MAVIWFLFKWAYYIFVISELETAGFTSNMPCSPEAVCPDAYIQNLVGCDAAAGGCICERGYMLHGDICVGESAFVFI